MLTRTKTALTRMGAHLSPAAIRKADAALNYLAAGLWFADHGKPLHTAKTREQVFERVAAEVAAKEVLYLEFGVFQGAATLYWSKLLTNPCSRLHGFDSFVGLPEEWADCPKGTFSTNGSIPQIDDPRVEFFVGWFDETLPKYTAPPHDVIIANCDADLYSSTAYILSHIKPLLRPGSFIYFDEFIHRHHEMRAFSELLESSDIRFQPFAATPDLVHVAFRVT